MFDRRELLVLAVASAASPGKANATVAARDATHRAASRATEVHALRAFAESTHPRGREARDDHEWQAHWARLERTANVLSDGAYFVELRRALAWFEDGHTTVLPFEFLGKVPEAFARGPFNLRLPWKVKVFDDGAYIVSADATGRASLGSRVDQVGALSAIDLMKAVDASWPGNRAWAQNWAASVFASLAQLQALGAMRDPREPLRVRLLDGHELVLTPTSKTGSLQEIDRTKGQHELWAEEAKRDNYVKLLSDRKAIYLSIDDMADVAGATFEQLTKEAFVAMESPANRLIIDLRRNGGGDNFLGEALRKGIERSRFNRRGGIYVLAGPATFSAAQNLANRLERETYAIFIGGPTGLAPNHYGDAKIFAGPVTGLTAMVSTLPWFDSYPQDKRQWIMPDRSVPATFDDWRNGRDPALDLALADEDSGPSADWSNERVFFYGRASQKADWKTFWT